MMTPEDIAYNAYRLGVLDTMLHEDVQTAIESPGIIKQQMVGERRYRLSAITEQGITIEHRISEEDPNG